MSRTTGALNHDHEVKRQQLARRVLRAVLAGGSAVSLSEIAEGAGCSIPTLKHYFHDRSGAVAEALRTVRDDAAAYIGEIAQPGALRAAASLTKVATDLAIAWQSFGVGQVFAVGMAAGLSESQVGPGYLDGVLEPTVLAIEARLRVHAERGELSLDPRDALAVRTAALSFVSPLLVALLHQHALDGARCRPLDLAAFAREHVSRFLRAYAPNERSPRRAARPGKRARKPARTAR